MLMKLNLRQFPRLVLYALVVAVLSPISIYAQPGTETPHDANSQLVMDLSNYHWKMKMMLPGEGEKQGLHELYPEDIETLVWNIAQVPGDVYTDLWRAGGIEDPYFGRNSIKAQWVQHYEWWYTVQFNVTEETENKHVRICFDGVDYSCDVWLNGHYLGSHEGAFDPFSFDVTEALRVGDNPRTSSNMLTVKLNPPTHVNTKLAGLKSPWFGDYWRDLIPFGIWQPVKMVSSGMVNVDDLYAKTKINKDGSADVDLELTLENHSSVERNLTITASLEGKNFEGKKQTVSFDAVVPAGKKRITHNIHVKDPQLWWPWDMGKPNLYTAKVTVAEDHVNHDFSEVNFGIREITSDWNPGFVKGVDLSFPRTTVINGKPIFIRSACWGGTPNIFVGRTAPGTYEKLLTLAKEANLNNIRIFGWHNPEIKEFYDICDSLGLTIWQDMVPLGSGNIPREPARVDNILNKAVATAKVRRNHPSLIMMEGGEEYFLRTRDAQFANELLLRLGDSLQKYLPLPYVPDSPLNYGASQEAGYLPNEAHHALRYFYDMGDWLMEDWYHTIDSPIIPEFAVTSVPSVESLRKFIPEDELWPPGLSWGHHWADFKHLELQNYDAFGETYVDKGLEAFVNATQDAQGIVFQSGIEYFRRNKPRTSGVALCHWITYWPDMKWGIVDAYQQPKRSYDFVKRAFQPLLVSFDFDRRRWLNDEPLVGGLWIVNDQYISYKGATINAVVKDYNGVEIYSNSYDVKSIGENSAFKVADFKSNVLSDVDNRFTVELELISKSGEKLSANEYLFLIGDHAKESAKFKEMGQELKDINAKYLYGNYYGYFPALTGEDGEWQESDVETPRAKGFSGPK